MRYTNVTHTAALVYNTHRKCLHPYWQMKKHLGNTHNKRLSKFKAFTVFIKCYICRASFPKLKGKKLKLYLSAQWSDFDDLFLSYSKICFK